MLSTIVGLNVGDKIFVLGAFGIKHFGIYLGKRRGFEHCIIHNAKEEMVLLDSLENFRQGKQLYLDGWADAGYGEHVAQYALSFLGLKYDLLFFNCEHFVTVAYGGKPESKQLQGLIAILGVGILGYVMTRNPNTYDRGVGRYRDSYGRFAAR